MEMTIGNLDQLSEASKYAEKMRKKLLVMNNEFVDLYSFIDAYTEAEKPGEDILIPSDKQAILLGIVNATGSDIDYLIDIVGELKVWFKKAYMHCNEEEPDYVDDYTERMYYLSLRKKVNTSEFYEVLQTLAVLTSASTKGLLNMDDIALYGDENDAFIIVNENHSE